jgi:hypothetical protein
MSDDPVFDLEDSRAEFLGNGVGLEVHDEIIG